MSWALKWFRSKAGAGAGGRGGGGGGIIAQSSYMQATVTHEGIRRLFRRRGFRDASEHRQHVSGRTEIENIHLRIHLPPLFLL
jgi:hypothetical protein